jgi:nitroreductase
VVLKNNLHKEDLIMEFNKVIEERRSIRKYKADAPVEKAVVEEIIKAAQQAPSWKNSQTGRYYVAISPEKVETVRKSLPEFNQNNSANAPVLIVTAFEKGIAGFNNDGGAVNEVGDEWGAYDLGLQNENLVLKARELGLDTLIMGIRNSEVLRTEFNIPESQQIVSVIALGHRDIEPNPPARKAVEDIAKFY